MQLGLLAELQGDYPTAAERLTQAIDREDHNWQLYYLRSKVEHEAGEAAAARADLEQARRLNPLETCLAGRLELRVSADDPARPERRPLGRRRPRARRRPRRSASGPTSRRASA